MSYKLKCPGCDVVQSVGQLQHRDDGTIRCGRCAFNGVLTAWTSHTHPAIGAAPPNALPKNAYVVWGTKTKHSRSPALIRHIMEGQAEIRPGSWARPNGGGYTPLNAGSSSVFIYVVKDNVMLRGQYYAPPANNDGIGYGLCVMLLNGSGASIGHYMQDVVAGYQAWGAAVLAVDYRGIGESTGSGTAHGLYTDAEVMLDYLTDDRSSNGLGWREDRVVVHGFSIGSAPATDLAKKRSANGAVPFGGLVLHCPIGSFASTARFKQRQVGAGETMQRVASKVASWGVGFNNVDKMLHVTMPVHVVYAVGDTFVDPQDAVALANVQHAGNSTIQAYRFGDHTDCDRIFNNNYNVANLTTSTLDAFVTGLPRM